MTQPTEGRAPRAARVVAYALLSSAVLLRLSWPFRPPLTHVDEGGWPLSVREWAVDGLVTFDFHKAPLYHLVLGTLYRIAPPTMLTARLLSVILGLVSLALLWWIAVRLLADRRAALWSVLLWASCFPASDLAGRALIEPLQLMLLLALLAALCSHGRRAGPLVALATAALLLTKANALVALPGLGLALFWDRAGPLHVRRDAKAAGLAAGIALAAFAFVGLWLLDPDTFRRGWDATVVRPDVITAPGSLRLGRFVLDPRLVEQGLEYLAGQTPFLFAIGMLGALRALSLRSATAPALALGPMLILVLLQGDQPPQYFATLYPLLALAAAGLMGALNEGPGGRSVWPTLAVAVIAAEGMSRTVAASVLLPPPERPAVEWLRSHTDRSAPVMAAPYILMQLRNPAVSAFVVPTFPAPPDAAALARTGVRWIAVDSREWGSYAGQAGLDSTIVEAGFSACCERVFSDPAVRLWRVREPEPTAR